MKQHRYLSGFIVLSLCFLKCGSQKQETEIQTKTFDLKKDIYNFSEEMTEKDTLYFLADLSVCLGRSYYHSAVTKENDTVYISTKAIDETGEPVVKYFAKTKYLAAVEDSLTLENAIICLEKYGVSPKNKRYPSLTIVHQTDTLFYYTEGILERLNFSRYYTNILFNIYPENQWHNIHGFVSPGEETE
jgi:hypothetical protein